MKQTRNIRRDEWTREWTNETNEQWPTYTCIFIALSGLIKTGISQNAFSADEGGVAQITTHTKWCGFQSSLLCQTQCLSWIVMMAHRYDTVLKCLYTVHFFFKFEFINCYRFKYMDHLIYISMQELTHNLAWCCFLVTADQNVCLICVK